MVRMFVRHEVADYAAWRTVYDSIDSERSALGVTGHAVFTAVDDPNNVTVWHDFASLEAAQSFAGSSELREAMGRAGVQGKPDVWFATAS